MIRNLFRRLLGVAVVMAASLSTAEAGLLPVAVTITPDAGNYRWTYAIVLPTDSKLEAGNFFTIYDFKGYIPGTEQSPNRDWSFSSQTKGPTPNGLLPTDDESVVNLTWRYNGETIPSGQIGLGNFWAISTYGQSVVSSFTATTGRTSDGATDSNITETLVPTGTPTDPNTVPEPMTLVMAGLGLPLIGLARRFRK